MRLVNTIERVTQSEQLILAYIISSYVKVALQRIGRDMVPHTFDTVVRGRSIVKVRMRQVESNIHHSYYHILSRICLWQLVTTIDRQGIDVVCQDVGMNRIAAIGFNARNAMVERKHSQPIERYACDVNITILCEYLAMVVSQQLLPVFLDSDKGAHFLRLCTSHLVTTLLVDSLLVCNLAQHRRHLTIIRPLRVHLQGKQRQQ